MSDESEAPTKSVTVVDPEKYAEIANTQVVGLLERADQAANSIADNESMEAAIEIGSSVRGRMKEVDRVMGGISKPLWLAWRRTRTLRNSLMKPLEARLRALEKAVGDFKVLQERRRREEEEALQAEVRRRQEEEERLKREREEENRRRQEKYEREKLECEVSRDHEEAKRQNDYLDAEKRQQEKIEKEKAERLEREEEARLSHAVAAEDAGSADKVNIILDTATPVEPAPQDPPPIPKPEPVPEPDPILKPEPIPEPEPVPATPLPAVITEPVKPVTKASHSAIWRTEVENMSELLSAIAKGKVSTEAVSVNQGWLDRQAQKKKDRFSIPGVKAFPEHKTIIKE